MCSALGLTQLINNPTTSTLKTSSLLDHILINSKESGTQHGVLTLGISDHGFIFCTCVNTILVKIYETNFSVSVK